MAKVQRTINPLHFEDLEPHRFEDLIRQLAYAYRPWRYLDATGKLGRDGGTDIRGIEVTAGAVTTSDATADAAIADDADANDAAEGFESVDYEREWRISCKRYKELGPTLMRDVVAETLIDLDSPPYGFVLAVACDVSADAMAAFREESLARGAREAHLWTKAHLEDKLFLPENDHLLFAYFGISLGVRRRSRLQRIRSEIAIKRKLMRAAEIEQLTHQSFKRVLVRDIADASHPDRDAVLDFHQLPCPPWHPVGIETFGVNGLVVERFGYQGRVRDDGTWDIHAPSKTLPYGIGHNYWRSPGQAHPAESALEGVWKDVPEEERKYIRVLSLIPFDFILEVDPIGDTLNDGPHLFCRFDGPDGPYGSTKEGGSSELFVTAQGLYMPSKRLHLADRRSLIQVEK